MVNRLCYALHSDEAEQYKQNLENDQVKTAVFFYKLLDGFDRVHLNISALPSPKSMCVAAQTVFDYLCIIRIGNGKHHPTL